MPGRKTKTAPAKKTKTRKTTSTKAKQVGFEKAESVISRRNQNGTVMLMAMDKSGSFFKVDGIAAEVWAALESPNTLEAVTNHFKKRYPAKSKTMARDIEGLVKKLVKFDLMTESKGPFNPTFPALTGRANPASPFGKVQEYDLLKIESEVLNESVYLDVFAGSDLKLKSHVAPIRNALAKVLQLDGITHRWKSKAVPARKKPDGNTVHAGLIAQQVAVHMPELVRADKETGFLAVEYRKLNSYLVEAIKDLNEIVRAQEARIKKLERNRLVALS